MPLRAVGSNGFDVRARIRGDPTSKTRPARWLSRTETARGCQDTSLSRSNPHDQLNHRVHAFLGRCLSVLGRSTQSGAQILPSGNEWLSKVEVAPRRRSLPHRLPRSLACLEIAIILPLPNRMVATRGCTLARSGIHPCPSRCAAIHCSIRGDVNPNSRRHINSVPLHPGVISPGHNATPYTRSKRAYHTLRGRLPDIIVNFPSNFIKSNKGAASVPHQLNSNDNLGGKIAS